MSETADAQPHTMAIPGDAADKQAFAQVERWMAVIREISRKHDHLLEERSAAST
jgi:hypothetical protein